MQQLMEFFTFKHFITPYILILFYYIGALLMPLLMFYYKDKLIQNSSFLRSLKDLASHYISSHTKIVLILLFLMMELFWRMMFEMIIGYFQMHDYLQQLSS